MAALPAEAPEFADDFRRLFQELDRSTLTGECSPPLDVFETDDTIEVAVDLPSVSPTAVRVAAKGNAILIAGEKTPRRGRGDASFHLVERGYGRFARVVRVSAACDTSRAKATLTAGELRVSLPKLKERRSRTIPITIAGEPSAA
jgi:HSP20 family protein